jgi:hypothetical protein
MALLPIMAFAAGAATETVYINVNITAPGGDSIIGTVVAERQLADITTTHVTFTGMINGSPASLAADATERWSGDGQAQIEITNITNWQTKASRPTVLQASIVQTGLNLITVNGVPFAIDRLLAAPGKGRTPYVITNPGQGSRPIVMLPNTGMGIPLVDPVLIVGLLVGTGSALVLLSGVLRRRARRQQMHADQLSS